MISKFHPTIYQFEKGRPSDQAYHDLVGNLTGMPPQLIICVASSLKLFETNHEEELEIQNVKLY